MAENKAPNTEHLWLRWRTCKSTRAGCFPLCANFCIFQFNFQPESVSVLVLSLKASLTSQWCDSSLHCKGKNSAVYQYWNFSVIHKWLYKHICNTFEISKNWKKQAGSSRLHGSPLWKADPSYKILPFFIKCGHYVRYCRNSGLDLQFRRRRIPHLVLSRTLVLLFSCRKWKLLDAERLVIFSLQRASEPGGFRP